MTSCFSGGWVVQTDRMTSKPVLNATLMTAAGPEDSSESWPKSESSGRAGGSIFVTALLRSAIKQQTQEAGDETEDVATGSLIPFEIYEIARKLSPVRIALFVVNVAIVIYLIVTLRKDRRQRARDSA